jgi:hypothetical protein
MRANITAKSLERLQPSNKPYFIRSTKLRGFAVKINPSGNIKFIAETKFQGKTHRMTLGNHPILSIQEAEKQARNYLQLIQSGTLKTQTKDISLGKLFNTYTCAVSLKPNTLRNYKEVINFYLSDWLKKPVASISKLSKRYSKCLSLGTKETLRYILVPRDNHVSEGNLLNTLLN